MAAERPPSKVSPSTPDVPATDETAPPQRSPLARALPFGEETAPPQRSPLAAALPFRRPTERAKLENARTVAFSMPESAALPPGASSGGAPRLSIEQYAALCAEVSVSPETAEATFAKYGLASPEERAAADLEWQERLRADAALMQRWQTLYLHYSEQLYLTGRR